MWHLDMFVTLKVFKLFGPSNDVRRRGRGPYFFLWNRDKKCDVLSRKLHFDLKWETKCNFQPKTAHFLSLVFEKGHDQKMFGPLFSDSAYFSDAKTTFGMFGMICFGVDSQIHTLCTWQLYLWYVWHISQVWHSWRDTMWHCATKRIKNQKI
jgi:hypothetical protein